MQTAFGRLVSTSKFVTIAGRNSISVSIPDISVFVDQYSNFVNYELVGPIAVNLDWSVLIGAAVTKEGSPQPPFAIGTDGSCKQLLSTMPGRSRNSNRPAKNVSEVVLLPRSSS